LKEQVPPDLELQINVSKLLSRGFIFSVVWLGGIGSLLALLSGLRARKFINRSGGKIAGIRMAWWCIIVGALGTMLMPPLLISIVINQLKY
jgi:hypothetical protein